MRQLLRREDCGPVSGRAYAQALKYLPNKLPRCRRAAGYFSFCCKKSLVLIPLKYAII